MVIYLVINSVHYTLNTYFANTDDNLKFEDYLQRLFININSNNEYIDFSDPFLFLGLFTIIITGFVFVSFPLKELNQFSLLRFKKVRSLLWVYYVKAVSRSFLYVSQLPIYILLSLMIINYDALITIEFGILADFLMYFLKLLFFFIFLSQLFLFFMLYKEKGFATYFTFIFIMVLIGLDIYIPYINLILYSSTSWFIESIFFWFLFSILVTIIGNTILTKKGVNLA
ncbi:hypothetical protein HXZ66_17410 [Bacillus sp. A116_S68]|nr:hypothetical protein HXZ66_17410 [Bacillus sp. A116_S68]